MLTDRLIDAGFDVLLKPHPRGDADHFAPLTRREDGRCRFAPTDQAIESMFANLTPGRDILVGLNSTCLLTASLLYGLDAYSIGDVLSARQDVGDWYKALHEGFGQLAGRHVQAVDPEDWQPGA
jgi:hypothetical protein